MPHLAIIEPADATGELATIYERMKGRKMQPATRELGGPPTDELDRALVELADIVTLAPWRLGPAAYQRVRTLGLADDAQVFDAVATASSCTVFSRIATARGLRSLVSTPARRSTTMVAAVHAIPAVAASPFGQTQLGAWDASGFGDGP